MVTRRTPTFPAGSDCPNRAQPCFLSRLACRFSFRLFDAGFLAGFPLLSLFATNITLQPRSGRFIGACRDRPTSLDSRRPRTSVLSRVGTVLRCSITRYHEFAASLVAQSGHVRVRRCHRRCRPQRSGSRSGTHALRSACARRRGSRRHRRRDANRGVDLPRLPPRCVFRHPSDGSGISVLSLHRCRRLDPSRDPSTHPSTEEVSQFCIGVLTRQRMPSVTVQGDAVGTQCETST